MPADTRGRSERRIAKRFRLRRAADFKRVNAEFDARVSHLVGVSNVHHALAVLVEFSHLSDLGLADSVDGVEGGGVEGGSAGKGAGGEVIEARDDFGDLGGSGEGTSGIDALQ